MKGNDVVLKLSVEKIIPQKRTTCFGLYSNHQVLRTEVLRYIHVYVNLTAKSYDRSTASSKASTSKSKI